MINRFYKRIYNKYSTILKFFFFLRYIFVIFLISITLFLTIPKFLDYDRKLKNINAYLTSNYDLEIDNYSLIEFKIFPLPHLNIQNVNLKIINKPLNLRSNNFQIFVNLKNIYNYENFKAKKVFINEGKIALDLNKVKELINYVSKLNDNLNIKNLNLVLKKNTKTLVEIKKISFSNYGYKKYEIIGEIFEEKFKASIKNNNKKINFDLLDAGVRANFILKDDKLKDFTTGSSKIILSNNLVKFDFNISDNELKLFKSNFRNKDLSFSLDSYVKFKPFFSTKTNIIINEINKELIKKLSLNKIFENKKIIKKLNSQINLDYKSKKYFTELIENYSFNINLAYGRLVFSNKVEVAGGNVECNGDTILSEEYPRLDFNCFFDIYEPKKLSKKFSIPKINENKPFDLNIDGSINLINNKVNFKKINSKKNYLANQEDLKYFKDKFESILLNDGFFQILNQKKIKKFILEII